MSGEGGSLSPSLRRSLLKKSVSLVEVNLVHVLRNLVGKKNAKSVYLHLSRKCSVYRCLQEYQGPGSEEYNRRCWNGKLCSEEEL
jgi:hypothetical protein